MNNLTDPDSKNAFLHITGMDIEIVTIDHEQPFASHGIFKIRNLSTEKHEIHLINLFLKSGPEKKPIDFFKIYILPDYKEITNAKFVVDAKEEITIRVTFNNLIIPPRLNSILAEFISEDFKYSVESSLISIQERTKKY